MSRPLRIEYSDACYHVINRGDDRRRVFAGPEDYELFLGKLGLFSEIYRIRVRAYCLMPNHFHLYIQTPEGNLSRFMQAFLTSFTSTMNHRKKTSGHLFQGRYKSITVEDRSYGMALCHYIHLNPVRTQEFSECPLSVKRNVLREFRWSSYQILIGLKKVPEWIDLRGSYPWPGSTKEKQKRYAAFVEEGLLKDLDDFKQHIKAQAILGSDSFTETLKRKYLDLKKGSEDCPQGGKISAFAEFADISKAIADFYGVERESLLLRCRKGNEPRQALIHYSAIYCRGRYSLTELSNMLNLSIGGYSSCRRSIRARLSRDKNMDLRFKKIKNKLDNVKCKN